MASLFKLKVLLYLSFSLSLVFWPSTRRALRERHFVLSKPPSNEEGRTDGRAVCRQNIRTMFEEEIERPGRFPVIRARCLGKRLGVASLDTVDEALAQSLQSTD